MSLTNISVYTKVYWISLFSVFFIGYKTTAQVNTYGFSTATGASLNSMAGSTQLIGSGQDDVSSSVTGIGFTFNFGCIDYTQFSVSSNGLMGLGSTAVSSSLSNLTTGASTYPIIMPMWDDMHTGSNGKVHYLLSGSSPNRVLTVEWLIRNYGESGNYTKQVQVRLYEGTNVVEIVYGTGPGTNPSSASVGIASSTTAFHSVTTNANTSSTVTANDANTTFPSSGRKYTFTPSSMSFSSSNVVQSSTANTTKCDFDQDVICLQVVTTGGCLSPLSLTSIQLGIGSSSSGTLADISKIHVYYTGTTNSFNTTNEFVAGGTVPSGGTNTLNGSQTLSIGTNYFWIAYDINPSATTSNAVDAAVNSFTLAATNRIPTTTNPGGSRTIAACSAYPSTKALGLQHWVKSDIGVTGTSSVSIWADQSSGTSITGNMAQATANKQPSLVVNAINFQSYIRFDGTDDILVSANTFSGNALYNSSNNTIFMVKNLKSGIVDYKWETDPTNATRMGFELNGSAQRFDFVDDLTGKNALSSTNIASKDVIVGGITDNITNTIRLNGNTDAVNNHGGIAFAPSSGTLKPLNIGANDLGNQLYCNVDIAEVMTFNVKLGASELRRVESYLALKYGITLGNNKGSGSSITYLSSDGIDIWSNQTGYHNHVIGIGRDNAAGNSGLNKLRSKSVLSLNSAVDILTIANGNTMGGSAFGTDKSFFVTGNNNASLPASAASNADLPTGIQTRLTRVWKGQETGTVGTISLKFDLSSVVGVAGVSGANDLSKVRLLVDADGVFATGATVVVPNAGDYDNVTDTIVFHYDFGAATGFYYTLGSIDKTVAPLPIQLISFEAGCENNAIKFDWVTASETNNKQFELQKSENGINYATMAIIAGQGNSTQMTHYEYTDLLASSTILYYRLKQTDFDGTSTYFNKILSVENLCETQALEPSIYPNPAHDKLIIKTRNDLPTNIELIDEFGQLVYRNNCVNQIEIETAHLAAGIYVIKASNTYKTVTHKLVITH